jgi:hypothetical protein
MTTDHDLDVRLFAARGSWREDLPALPEAFLDYVHASDAEHPAAVTAPDRVPFPVSAETPASVLAAQQLVADARQRRSTPVISRRRRPGRKTVLRMSAAVLAVAAAWTTAVLVAGPKVAAPKVAAPPPDGVTRADEVTLVNFDMPTFPLTLPTAPPGTAGPVFGGSGAGGASMTYTSTQDPREFVIIHVGSEPPPPGGSVSFPGSVAENVTIHGSPGVIVAPSEAQDAGVASLDWQRAPGQWVTIMAQGRYAERDLLTTIAGSLVDSPQAMPVQLHLAPAGYSLDFFKDNGHIVRLGDDADPERGLTVRLPYPGELAPIGQLPDVLDGTAGPVEEVAVQGQPAQLVRTDYGGGGPEGWFLQARFADGTTFVVEAPGSLSREQVAQIANQVTYTP